MAREPIIFTYDEKARHLVHQDSILKYTNLQIFQSPLGFSVDQTDHITELVNEWFPNGKFRKFDINFSTDSTYEKELMSALPLTGNALCKSEMENYGKFGHTLGRI